MLQGKLRAVKCLAVMLQGKLRAVKCLAATAKAGRAVVKEAAPSLAGLQAADSLAAAEAETAQPPAKRELKLL
ncbi:hypothetical protein D3C81_2190650 [compost metagenome]